MGDENLIERSIAAARKGSFSALGQLFDVYRDYLLHIARDEMGAQLTAKASPSDVVQEAFLNAAKGFERFQGLTGEEVRAWLRRILLNTIGDVRRHYCGTLKRDVAREVSTGDLGDGGQSLAGPVPTPSKIATRLEDYLRLRDAMALLSPEHRLVIELRNLEGWSFDEIAEKLNRSPDAARKLWARAIQKLSEELPSQDSGTS